MHLLKRIISKIDKGLYTYFLKKQTKKKYKNLILANDHTVYLNKKHYWIKKGFSATDVMIYSLNKNNYLLYLNEFDRWKLRDINGKYRILLDDKRLFHEFTKDFLPMPKLLGNIVNGKFYKNGKFTDLKSLVFPIVYKPSNSGGGDGFKVIDIKNGSMYLNNEQIDESDLFSINDNGIIEQCVVQNSFYSKFYSNSVNTLRIVSINDNGSFSITNAVLRMGTSTSGFVDNASSGGIFSTINLESGELSSAHSYYKDIVFENHPDTGERIKGKIIPDFESIKKFVLENHAKLSFLKFIAWDIAVQKEGSLVCIEANTSSDLCILQCDESQKNKPLGLFMRKNGVLFK